MYKFLAVIFFDDQIASLKESCLQLIHKFGLPLSIQLIGWSFT